MTITRDRRLTTNYSYFHVTMSRPSNWVSDRNWRFNRSQWKWILNAFTQNPLNSLKIRFHLQRYRFIWISWILSIWSNECRFSNCVSHFGACKMSSKFSNVSILFVAHFFDIQHALKWQIQTPNRHWFANTEKIQLIRLNLPEIRINHLYFYRWNRIFNKFMKFFVNTLRMHFELQYRLNRQSVFLTHSVRRPTTVLLVAFSW